MTDTAKATLSLGTFTTKQLENSKVLLAASDNAYEAIRQLDIQQSVKVALLDFVNAIHDFADAALKIEEDKVAMLNFRR